MEKKLYRCGCGRVETEQPLCGCAYCHDCKVEIHDLREYAKHIRHYTVSMIPLPATVGVPS